MPAILSTNALIPLSIGRARVPRTVLVMIARMARSYRRID